MKSHVVDIPTDIAETLGICNYPGWVNPFTRRESPHARYKNGCRVRKVWEDPSGDLTPLGTDGCVLGSIYVPQFGCAYFVEWDDKPRVALFMVEKKIEAV